MISCGLMFVAVALMVRHLGSDLPAIQAAFIRYSFGAILLIPLLWRLRWRGVPRDRLPLYCTRGLIHSVAVMLWFFAMARIPVAEVTAIGFSTPIITALGAVLLFGERIRLRRGLAIFAGFVGTLIILRPGFQEISSGSLAQLVAAFFFAGSFLMTKRLTKTESSVDILIMLTFTCTLALLPGALYEWRTPTFNELCWLMLVAAFATAGHYALTKAISHAPLSVIQPLTFLQLVWAILFGYLLFNEVPDVFVISGAALIIIAISYLTHREAVVARRRKLEKI
ncbi:MAG: drug/metabolite transporter (DMT)-like permease [Parasphingorhabdus sp.]|jgi:drug/metabolite transporter (DMT)-like permease